MLWCVHETWWFDILLVFCVSIIRVTCTTSYIPSLEAPWGVRGRDYLRCRMWVRLCCLECGFLIREGAVKEPGKRTGEVLVLVSISTPTSSLTPCTWSPPMAVPQAPILCLWPLLLLYTHPPSQSHKSCSGTEASLEEMPTSSHVSTCHFSDP